MTASLQVLLHGEHVADLHAGSRLQLAYTDEAIAKFGIGGLCLSLALPVAARPYWDPARSGANVGKRRPVEYWCEGLLPEGETRTTLEMRFNVARGDTFGLLAAIGADCAGAVAFLDPDSTARPSGRHPALDSSALAAAITELPTRPLGADEDSRVSLGGLQAKLLLTRHQDQWFYPRPGTPSTHIFKPDALGLRRPGLVVCEAIVMRAAHLIDIPTAQVDLVDLDGRVTLIVTRYDRREVDGVITRLHQEDGCQALGINPTSRHKYQHSEPGPPSYRALAALLATSSLDREGQLRKLAQQMIFSWAIGNTDAHARNYSLLLANDAQLAPMYDVAYTEPFATNRHTGLWIGGQSLLPDIGGKHLIREITDWGMSSDTARTLITSLTQSLPDAIQAASAQFANYLDDELLMRIHNRIATAQKAVQGI